MTELGGAGAELRTAAKAAGALRRGDNQPPKPAALRPALKRPSASGTRADLSEPSQARYRGDIGEI